MSLCRCKFYSKCLQSYVDVNVYVPSVNFFEALSAPLEELYRPEQRYPALYLLHGMMDDYDGWLRFSNVESYAEKHQVAVIMPDGQNGYWVNAKRGLTYFDFVERELRLWAESTFPLRRDRGGRFIAGLSMGGYGALRHGLANPESYAAIGCFSGTVDLLSLDKPLRDINLIVDWDSIFGGIDSIEGTDNDIHALARKAVDSCHEMGLELPRLYVGTGTEDPFVLEMTRSFGVEAAGLGYDVRYEEKPGGHLWEVWDPNIREFLEMVDES